MKAVTRFMTDDGTVFDDEDACREYERDAADCDLAMMLLGRDRSLSSTQYVQHSRDVCLEAKRALLAVARRRLSPDTHPVLRCDDDAIHPMSFVARLIDDSGVRCLQRAWWRLCRINWDSYREYEQPYFATHEHEATTCVP